MIDNPGVTAQSGSYQPPTITDLGTLAELTLGGAGTNADMIGGASGSAGSL